MKIQNGAQFWTGSCWSVVQAAEEYPSTSDLPYVLIGAGNLGEDLHLEIFEDTEDWVDARYYPDEDVNTYAVACVVN